MDAAPATPLRLLTTPTGPTCGSCQKPLHGRWLLRAFQRGIRLESGTVTMDDWLCPPCLSTVPTVELTEWLPVVQLVD